MGRPNGHGSAERRPTGAEAAIAGGTSADGTKLLDALLGDQAVRRLAEQARTDLDRRVGVVLDREAQRFYRQLDSISLDIDAANELRAAGRELANEIRSGALDHAGKHRSPNDGT